MVVGLGSAAVGVAALRDDGGAPPGAAAASPAPTTTSTTGTAALPPPSSPSTTSTLVPTPDTEAVPAPATVVGAGRLDLPTLGVAAPVTEVRVRPNGELEVPALPSQVGWWADGAEPGSGTGSVVIDGHVDSARYGRGAFFRLRDLAVGDPVDVATAEGDRFSYRVTAVQQYPKDQLPWAEVFSQEVPERLVLVTCGGDFDRASRRYTDNVVAYAEPT